MVHIGDHLRFGPIICDSIWGSFAVGDHLWRCTDLIAFFPPLSDNNNLTYLRPDYMANFSPG